MRRFLITIFCTICLTLGLMLSAHALTFNSSNTSASNLKNGLVGWWTFDGVDISGNTVFDKSGQNNTGIKDDGSAQTLGKIGQGLKFNGVSGKKINVGNPVSLQLATGTLSVWVKKDATPVSDYMGILTKPADYGLYFTSPTGLQFYSWGVGGVNLTRSIFDNKWHHVVASFAAGLPTKIYLDGVLNNTGGNFSYSNLSSINVSIGNATDVITRTLNGSLDDVRIYNRTLSPVEILELYAQGGGKVNKADLTRAQLKTGLVGWWTMDGMDFSSSVTTTDKSGNGNNGRLVGGIKRVSGRIGQALKFDGATGYVKADIPDFTSNTISGSAWVKPIDVTNCRQVFLSSGKGEFIFAQPEGACNKIRVWIHNGLGWGWVDSLSTIVIGKWYHTSFTWDGNSLKIYINGILDNSTGLTGTIQNLASPSYWTTVGTVFDLGSSFYKGTIDDARIYNRALTPVEILELYAQGGGKVNKSDMTRAQLKTGLVGYWTFDGMDWASSLLTLDKSGNSNTGTLVGGVTKVSGKIGQGVRFNGSTGMVNVADSASLSFGNGSTDSPFSISMWVKPVTPGIAYLITKEPNTNTNREWLLGAYSDGKIQFSLYTYEGGRRIARAGPSASLTAGRWHHVIATYDGSKNQTGLKIFINNSRVDNENTSFGSYTGINDYASPVIIGAGDRQTVLHNGSIDEVRIYNRELSLTEITELFKMGK